MDAMEKVWRDYAANQEISRELNAVAEKKADLAFPADQLVARFHEEKSFASTLVLPHFFSITVLRLRPGHAAPFEPCASNSRPRWSAQAGPSGSIK